MFNWYALLLCMVSDKEILSSEDAFDSLEKMKTVRRNTIAYYMNKQVIPINGTVKEQSIHMLQLKNRGYTYKQIGNIYGIDKKAVYARIVRIGGKRKKVNQLRG